jgi:hypothetical protein
MGPRSVSIFSKTFFMFSRSVTSQLYATALTPAFSQASFVLPWISTVRSSNAILAPVFAMLSAIVAPIPGSIELMPSQKSGNIFIPPAAPVTTATLPVLVFTRASAEIAGYGSCWRGREDMPNSAKSIARN